jgi:hypothetical protein
LIALTLPFAESLDGPLQLSSAAAYHRFLRTRRVHGIGRHVSGIADPFNGHIDAFRISHIQRSDGWIETTWNNMSDPGAFAAAGAEEQKAASRRRLPTSEWSSA